MAWNEPGGGEPKDPWGNNRGNQHQGPPDLDELLRKLGATLGGLLGGGGKGGGTAQGDGGSSMGGLLLGLLVLLLFLLGYNALYTINQQERGIVLRFGRYESSVMPGLHWKIPLIDALYKVNVTRVRDRNHRSLMLTEDENIVDVSVTVQYVVSDPKDFLLRVRDPESALENATESALRHVVGTS
ncbi:MAG TPA: protease modulator HflK, partial [Pseudomonadales bacterium]|nr:protease modulator HflK [Pseudomonadales bacterium]